MEEYQNKVFGSKTNYGEVKPKILNRILQLAKNFSGNFLDQVVSLHDNLEDSFESKGNNTTESYSEEAERTLNFPEKYYNSECKKVIDQDTLFYRITPNLKDAPPHAYTFPSGLKELIGKFKKGVFTIAAGEGQKISQIAEAIVEAMLASADVKIQAIFSQSVFVGTKKNDTLIGDLSHELFKRLSKAGLLWDNRRVRCFVARNHWPVHFFCFKNADTDEAYYHFESYHHRCGSAEQINNRTHYVLQGQGELINSFIRESLEIFQKAVADQEATYIPESELDYYPRTREELNEHGDLMYAICQKKFSSSTGSDDFLVYLADFFAGNTIIENYILNPYDEAKKTASFSRDGFIDYAIKLLLDDSEDYNNIIKTLREELYKKLSKNPKNESA